MVNMKTISYYKLNYTLNEYYTTKRVTKYLFQVMKCLPALKATNKHLLLIIFLICFISVQATTSTIKSTYSKENSFYINDLSVRIRNYAAKILNTTTVFDAIFKNGPNFFLPKFFTTSFIFYSDGNSSNVINRKNGLQKHFINKMPPNRNLTKANFKNQRSNNSNINGLASEEDYLYDDYVSDPFNKMKSKPNETSSCSACQQHQRAKKENLESIKKHILMRLQLAQPPNITVPPPTVPQKILDYFYKNFNYSRSKGHSPFRYGRKNYKKKNSKQSPVSLEDEIRDEGNNNKYIDENYNDGDENEDDIMINDNTFFDDNFSTPLRQLDEFYSRLHSIYVFPTKSRIHYNRKPEVFNFKFNSDPSRISSTILHVFIKGQDWIYEYQPDLMDNKNKDVFSKRKLEIMIVIYRALRRPNSMNFTHTVKLTESRQKIPPGFGKWVEIEIKELSTYWIKAPNSTQSIVIRGMESWMRTFIVTEDQNDDKLTMHIEIVTKVNHRNKRNTALDCRESDNEVRCCRYPLKVNFTNFGWNFIVAPQHFDAYFCNGECNVGYLEKYTHTHITSLSTSAKPCCSPQKLSPLALLYFDNNNKLMYSTIPNMSVEKCSCS